MGCRGSKVRILSPRPLPSCRNTVPLRGTSVCARRQMSWDCHDPPSDRDSVSLPPPHRVEENVFRRIVDSVRDYAIFLLDARGIVRTWNTGAQVIKGYAPEEIIGQHFSKFYPQEAIARRWPDR